MKKRTLLLSVVSLCTAFSTTIFAQDNTGDKKSTTSGNWFISAGLGGDVLNGEQDHLKNIGDRIRLGGEVSVGKWFNPNFGMRTQFMGGGMRGYNLTEPRGGEYTRADRTFSLYPIGYPDKLKYTDDTQQAFWQDFGYQSLTLDLMMNLTNLFRGYYKESLVEVIPFIGFGYLHGNESNTNPNFSGIVGKGGLRVNFNLNNRWAIFVEGQGNLASEEFDGYKGDRGFDSYFNGLVGVQFNINKGFKNPSFLSSDEVNRLNDRLNDQRQMIDNQQNILERQQRMINELENKTVPVAQPQSAPVSVQSKGYLPDYIRFGLNSSALELVERTKLEDAASYLKANPGSKLLVIGYADKKTGSSSYNFELSQQRAEAVTNELSRLGISSSRIITKWMGDKEQPYNQNDWNRVVVMVER